MIWIYWFKYNNLNKCSYCAFVRTTQFFVVHVAAMSKSTNYCQSCLHCLFHYETTKTLVIPSLRVWLVFRFAQLLVLQYVVGWVLNVTKQSKSYIISWACCFKAVQQCYWPAAGMCVWCGRPTRKLTRSSAPSPLRSKASSSPTHLTWSLVFGTLRILSSPLRLCCAEVHCEFICKMTGSLYV